MSEVLLRGEKTSLANEEAIGRKAQGGVMMKAAPATSFIMVEPEFLLEILVIPFNPPAQFGHVNQIDQGDRRRQGREPVLGRLRVALWPLDQQPLLRMRLGPPIIAMGRTHPHRGEAPAQVTSAALAPPHRLPGTRRQGESEVLGADRLMLGIPALELGPAPLARLGRQGTASRRPDAKGGLHTQDIAQGQGSQRRAEVGLDAIGGIAQHNTGRAGPRPARGGSAPARSAAWFEKPGSWAPPPWCGGPDRWPTPPAGKDRRQPAGCPHHWPGTATRRLGSYPACPTGRSIGAPRRRNGILSWESRCRRGSRR